MALVSVSVFDSTEKKTMVSWTIYQEDDGLSTRRNIEDLVGYSVDEVRVGSGKESLDLVGDSSK